MQHLSAIVLAGGSGTRFWPVSRRERPKQLLALEGDRSLLQTTVDRLQPLVPAADVWIATGEHLAAPVRAQLPEVPSAQIRCEPAARNTAAAIGWAVRSLPEPARDGVVAVLPSDHRMADAAAFRDALATAAEAVRAHDVVMTLGVTPRWAETGYGYLELGDPIAPGSPVRRVVRFREKPDAATAAAYLASGRHLWNGGIFVFRGTTLLHHLARLQPGIAEGLERIAADPASIAEVYPRLPSVSIDHGVMESLDSIATLPLDCGWSDLGSWEALAEVLPHDGAGNATRGDALVVGGRDNLVFAEQGTVTLLDVDGLVVVRSGDAVLVLPKARAQEVRQIVAALERAGRRDLL